LLLLAVVFLVIAVVTVGVVVTAAATATGDANTYFVLGLDVNHDWKRDESTVGFVGSYGPSPVYDRYHVCVSKQKRGQEIVCLQRAKEPAQHGGCAPFPKRSLLRLFEVANS